MSPRSPSRRNRLLSRSAAALLGTLLSACGAADSTAPAMRFTPSFSGGSGGGGGGGGATTTTCSTITKFEPKPGYYPGSKTWGAIWTTVQLRACDASVTVHATLTEAPVNPPGPNYGYLPVPNFADGAAWSFTAAGGTVDWEPIELDAEFQVRLDVYDQSGNLVESRSAVVQTPVLVAPTTTTQPAG